MSVLNLKRTGEYFNREAMRIKDTWHNVFKRIIQLISYLSEGNVNFKLEVNMSKNAVYNII